MEVCVGRQVDRVRSGDEDGEGDNNNMMTRDTISHQEHKSEQYGSKHYHLSQFLNNVLLEKSLLPSISSQHSNEDVSSLQVKGASPALMINTPQTEPPPYHKIDSANKPKPILKNTRSIQDQFSSDQFSSNQRYYGEAGNWYTNPLDSSYFPTTSSYPQQQVMMIF